MYKTIIAIPIYKSVLTATEEISLRRCLTTLNMYDICLVTYNNLDIKQISDIIKSYNINHTCKIFDKKFFTDGTKGYNRLMLTKAFYLQFQHYDFILIYQLDGYVFKNDIEYWCYKNYSYIGAPIFEGFKECTPLSKYIGCMNGGVSLRKVKDMIAILNEIIKIDIFEEQYEKGTILNKVFAIIHILFGGNGYHQIKETSYNEDCMLSRFFIEKITNFKKRRKRWNWLFKYNTDTYSLPRFEETYHFSFDENVELLFQLSKNELPSFCHSFHNEYKRNFWQQFINLDTSNDI